MTGKAELMDAIVAAGPLTKKRARALRADMNRKGVGLLWRTGDSGRKYVIMKGEGGVDASAVALTILSPYLPLAIIQRGGVSPDGTWEVLVWINPPVSEYLRLEETSNTDMIYKN